MNFIKDLTIDKIQNLAEDAYNSAKPKTDVEARVYEVLSHKNWGASGSLMNEIARDTFDHDRFQVVAHLMWDGMENQRPAAWKVVFKSLSLLEHLVKNGAERCVDDARNHGHVLRSLGQFNYYEGTIDRGLGVREKSKQILEMLSDDERVREERQKARKLREKFGNFNKGSSGIGGGGSAGGIGGYGNQDSWNSGNDSGGYGEGGIYDNDKAYSGRYGNSSTTASAAAPTFAAMPGEKKKSKKKKKKQPAETKAAPAPAPEPVGDLLGFDDAPAPAPAVDTGGNNDFGAFQTSSAPAPAVANASDDFAAFDQIRSKNAQGPHPFAAAPAVAAPVQQFDAFGNNGGVSANNGMANNNMMMNNNMNNTGNMMNNNMMNNMNNNMAAIGNAFNNMSVNAGAPAGGMQQSATYATNDDDFGDFADAKATSSSSVAVTKSADPLAGLINLDSLTKNASKKMTMNQPVVPDAAAAQYQQDVQNGVHGKAPVGSVSAGGSDAISSMMGPVPTQQQGGSNFSMNSGGMPMNPHTQQQMQQQQFNQGMQNQGVQGGGMNSMMGGNPQMQGNMMYGSQMGHGGMMNNMNMNQMGMMNQMGGQQQQMNPQMMGGMGMQGGMNQMGGMGMQGGMNQMNSQMMGGMGMQGGMGGMR